MQLDGWFSTKYFGLKKVCYTVKINHKTEGGWWVLQLKNSLFCKNLNALKNHLKCYWLNRHFLYPTKKAHKSIFSTSTHSTSTHRRHQTCGYGSVTVAKEPNCDNSLETHAQPSTPEPKQSQLRPPQSGDSLILASKAYHVHTQQAGTLPGDTISGLSDCDSCPRLKHGGSNGTTASSEPRPPPTVQGLHHRVWLVLELQCWHIPM